MQKESKEMILNSELRDSGGKLIFDNSVLCSQFFRGYVPLPYLKNVRPEDIEDVSDQFVPLFAEERNADRVKKVHIRNHEIHDPHSGREGKGKEGLPFFLISLVEHKTKSEYDICMQIFRYMVYIWEDYAKEMEKKQKGITKRKGFRYPPILPIVYYEGKTEWIVPMDFKSRIHLGDVFQEYIPDFKYYLVPIQKYSNEELLEREDEISLIMLINKIQTLEDVKVFRDLPAQKVEKILENTPKDIVEIIAKILLAFQLKANVPLAEAEANVRKVREKNMARFFEYADFGDVQAQRKEKAALREEIERMKQEIEEKKQENERMNQENEWVKQENERVKQKAEHGIRVFVETLKECGIVYDAVKEKVAEKFGVDMESAEKKVQQYWN